MTSLTLPAPVADPDLADLDLDPIAPDDRSWWMEQTRDAADDAPDFDPTDDAIAEMMTRALIADQLPIL